MRQVLQTIWQALRQTVWGTLRPDSFYAWQTSLWMSLLAWLLAQAARAPEEVSAPISVHGILTTFSWLFLITAVGWLTTERPILIFGQNVGPWITGALVCLFLFVRRDYVLPRAALISWPLISTAIAAFPEFIQVDSGFSIPRSLRVRQRLCLVLLFNLLITSWISFGFRLQDWAADYPGLKGEAFKNSFFLADRRPEGEDFSRGIGIVREMEQQLKLNADGRTKAQVERWLFDNQRSPQMFRDAVMNALVDEDARQRDDRFWQLETRVSEPDTDPALPPVYGVTLRANWRGPRPRTAGHGVEKTCRVNFGQQDRAQVSCQEIKKLPSSQTQSGPTQSGPTQSGPTQAPQTQASPLQGLPAIPNSQSL